jgi:hypothetical protein
MSILRTRFIVALTASLMLPAGSVLAAEGQGGGFHGAMGAPHVEGHFGGTEHFAPQGQALAGLHHHFDFHRHDFGHFTPEERAHWRGGHWRHDWHDGRLGWWWILDGDWYSYPEPVYPYRDDVIPDDMSGWYYCANPLGYYPYVASCAVPWQFVPPAAPPP